MNAQNAKQYLPLVQALAEGKTIQVFNPFDSPPKWRDLTDLNFDKSPDDYRIKPEPKLRPWKPEKVPVGAIVRANEHTSRYVIICHSAYDDVIYVGYPTCNKYQRAHITSWQHSLDHGKTWQPCGVYEQS